MPGMARMPWHARAACELLGCMVRKDGSKSMRLEMLRNKDRVSTGPCPGNSKTISRSVIQFPGLPGK
eukprot:1158021-Pelagomonas_calceolata.AAC.3